MRATASCTPSRSLSASCASSFDASPNRATSCWTCLRAPFQRPMRESRRGATVAAVTRTPWRCRLASDASFRLLSAFCPRRTTVEPFASEMRSWHRLSRPPSVRSTATCSPTIAHRRCGRRGAAFCSRPRRRWYHTRCCRGTLWTTSWPRTSRLLPRTW